MKQLFLEDSDGDTFESICQHIFEEYFHVMVERTPLVGDGGKDLKIHYPGGMVYVECKHQANPVGRPIVQKFHSAMITDHISRGIIVSTGGFSKDAYEYIARNNLPIRTVDKKEFDDIAKRAGFIIIYGSVINGLGYEIKPYSDLDFKNLILNRIDQEVVVGSDRPSAHVSRIDRNTVFAKFYRVQYKINSELWTTKKDRLLNTITKAGYYYINSYNHKDHLSDEFAEIISKSQVSPRETTSIQILPSYPVTASDVQESLWKAASEAFNRRIEYMNDAGQIRAKEHKIKKTDLEIINVDAIIIPLTSFKYGMKKTEHSVDCVELGQNHGYYPINTDAKCAKCSTKLLGKRYMCGDCESLFCSEHRSFILECSVCGKTVCLDCAFYYRKTIFFRKPVCKGCSITLTKAKLKQYT